jgi:hypothetical protein
MFCAQNKKEKKVVAHDDHYNASFVFVASTWCCYLPPSKGLPELDFTSSLPCRGPYSKNHNLMQIPYTKFESLQCISMQFDSFLLLTFFFFTTDCLRNKHLQMKKENVKRRFDKQVPKTTVLLFVYVLWRIFPNTRTLGHYVNRRTSFFQLFLCSHQKTVSCMSEGSCIQGLSWGSGKPWALGLKSLNRTHLYMNLPYNVTTSERTLSVLIGQITFSNQSYEKSPRAQGVRL